MQRVGPDRRTESLWEPVLSVGLRKSPIIRRSFKERDRATKESPFGSTVAHGFLTLSLIPHLGGMVDAMEPAYPGLKLAVNYGLNRVRFPNPVTSGSNVRTCTKLVGVDKINDECFRVVGEVTIEIEGKEKPACVAEMVSRYYF